MRVSKVGDQARRVTKRGGWRKGGLMKMRDIEMESGEAGIVMESYQNCDGGLGTGCERAQQCTGGTGCKGNT